MAIEDIEQMTRPLSEEKQVASHSGDDVIKSAMIWMAGLPGSDGSPIGMDEVIRQLETGETDMGGLVNAYMEAQYDFN